MIKRKLIIKGPKVHNIGYRFFLYDEALRLGLSHFDARNIKHELEGVNIHVGGEEEKVKLLTAFAKNNFPPLAEVTKVTETPYTGDIRSIELFERSFMLEQQSKATAYGLGILNTLTSMDSKLAGVDGTLKCMDSTLTGIDKKQDSMLDKQDSMIDKQDMQIELSKEILRETKEGFEKVTQELKGFKELHEEIMELRQEINELKGAIARIEKKVAV
ncbi:acylphosphatase [archaeon BMS3Bbin16]|nr:acylphosphatase [archaeon BMS3Bbin16]